MSRASGRNKSIRTRLVTSLLTHGPLGTAKSINIVMERRFRRIPGYRYLYRLFNALIHNIHRRLDSSFDRKFRVDTSGYMPLDVLTIDSGNIKEGIWYEPISVKIFHQIMSNLKINFSEFTFVDFGSGKGRALFLASKYGFKKIIGVEFAEELYDIARRNIEIWNRHAQKQSHIETIHMDAAEYPVPDAPLVAFFYSPFREKTMEQVLKNLVTSFNTIPRKMVLIFYGSNTTTIELFRATKFKCSELTIRADWSQLTKYRAFLFAAAPHSIAS